MNLATRERQLLAAGVIVPIDQWDDSLVERLAAAFISLGLLYETPDETVRPSGRQPAARRRPC